MQAASPGDRRSPLGSSPEIEAAIDALYAGPLEAFVAGRNDLVKRLKGTGERDAAARVKALPKPSVSAWAMNQLWWHERDAFTALLDAGESVRRAQVQAAGPSEQAAAAKQRRACVDRLLAAAQTLLERAGHTAANATLRRIATSLDAAAAHGHRPIDAPGRFAGDLDPPGFELLGAPARPDATPSPGPDAKPESTPPASTPVRRRAASAEPAAPSLADAHARVAEAARRVDETTRKLDDAKLRAQSAADALATARSRAVAAQHEAEQAELVFRRAAKEAESLGAAASEALEQLRSATGLLARAQE